MYRTRPYRKLPVPHRVFLHSLFRPGYVVCECVWPLVQCKRASRTCVTGGDLSEGRTSTLLVRPAKPVAYPSRPWRVLHQVSAVQSSCEPGWSMTVSEVVGQRVNQSLLSPGCYSFSYQRRSFYIIYLMELLMKNVASDFP